MADPQGSQRDIAEQAADAVKEKLSIAFNGVNGSGEKPAQDQGMLFLALISKQSPDLQEGARQAYETWHADAKRKLMQGGAPTPDEEAIRARMAAEMATQLVALNNGKALSNVAEEKIKELMAGGAAAFSAAIAENEAALIKEEAEYRKELKAFQDAKKANPQAKMRAPSIDTVGILAVLSQPNAEGQKPTLNKVDVSKIKIDPAEQRQTSLSGSFEGIHGFVNETQGGAEKYLARIAGETWGSNDGWGGKYEGLNQINGGGGLVEDARKKWLVAFTSEEGLSALGKDAEYYSKFKLTDKDTLGPANMNNLMTQPMVDRGLVEFSNDQARQAWNMHLAGGLALDGKERLSALELEERMVDFAKARPDITLSIEKPLPAADAINKVELPDNPVSADTVKAFTAQPSLARFTQINPEQTPDMPRIPSVGGIIMNQGITVATESPQLAANLTQQAEP